MNMAKPKVFYYYYLIFANDIVERFKKVPYI